MFCISVFFLAVRRWPASSRHLQVLSTDWCNIFCYYCVLILYPYHHQLKCLGCRMSYWICILNFILWLLWNVLSRIFKYFLLF
jgi:hypothetical protein